MNIIIGEDKAQSLAEKYVVLRLDTFKVTATNQSQQVTSYCVIESMPLQEMALAANYQDLHENLMINYAKQNWSYCEQAIDHLMGRWGGELDSFYKDLLVRVNTNRSNGVSQDWSPIINR